MALSIGQLGVNLVGDYHQIVLFDQRGQGLQVRPGHDAAGGVGGEGQHQHLAFGGDGAFQLLRGQTELIVRFQLHVHRHAAAHLSQGAVAHKGGRGDNHLVPRLQHHPQGQIQGLAAAHGD